MLLSHSVSKTLFPYSFALPFIPYSIHPVLFLHPANSATILPNVTPIHFLTLFLYSVSIFLSFTVLPTHFPMAFHYSIPPLLHFIAATPHFISATPISFCHSPSTSFPPFAQPLRYIDPYINATSCYCFIVIHTVVVVVFQNLFLYGDHLQLQPKREVREEEARKKAEEEKEREKPCQAVSLCGAVTIEQVRRLLSEWLQPSRGKLTIAITITSANTTTTATISSTGKLPP